MSEPNQTLASTPPASLAESAARNEGVIPDARGIRMFSGSPHGPDTAPSHSSEEIVQAARQLESLQADKEWGAKVLAGDRAATAEFTRLMSIVTDASPADLAMAGVVPSGHHDVETGVGLRETISAVADMRALGMGEDVIRQSLEMPPVSREEYRMADLRRRELLSNGEWVKKLQAGDLATKREQRLLSIILASSIREA
jgi:hypothetical protein